MKSDKVKAIHLPEPQTIQDHARRWLMLSAEAHGVAVDGDEERAPEMYRALGDEIIPIVEAVLGRKP